MGERLTFVGGTGDTLHHGAPVHEFIVVYGAELEEGIVGVGLVGLQLGEEALGG